MQKRILLINNETHFIDDLTSALSQHSIDIIKFQTVKPTDVEVYDCVILSGGGTAGEVSESEQLYKSEIKIVHEARVPIFGICEGFQVIGAAYNSDFRILKNYRKGINNVRILIDDPIFKGLKKMQLRVFEYHHIAIKHLNDELIPLAVSEDGIEVMRHNNKLIYGSQFHPEELQDGNFGHALLHNFLLLI
ncbi:MAG: gamma-glutamyl-gamma-aminobutyrate hydrolase family protein [Flavobacteriaceae bacterium]